MIFKAFVVAPDGASVGQFGQPGSAPGLFGVAGAIVGDDNGNVIVADRQRSAVMVFDKNFRFVTEFGYRGSRPENLIRPGGLAVGSGGRVYVSQLRRRGVSVFTVTSE